MPCKVYLIVNDLNGFIKIGISFDPHKRKKALESACGYRLRLLSARTPKREAKEVEKELHLLFGENRQLGEWFSISESEAKAALLKACGNGISCTTNTKSWWQRRHLRRRR
ncbi:GIY-YIG nuclease family protein [Neiella sp. HB171785]|uniref:GIY-YIG nuclease family protein n=1 Tax=Neiella litorisoli TaxID=2771431 RepID=A0A8J6UEJ8_9GAMM|nr:GIY-YIG nuclease family protein [Neiella litorisoli]